jgi:hypothetical protein
LFCRSSDAIEVVFPLRFRLESHVIDNKYIQVLTEYEGLHQEYTEFFRKALTPVFAAIFDLAEGAPDVNDPTAFWEYTKDHNYQPLGKSTSGSTDFDGNPARSLAAAKLSGACFGSTKKGSNSARPLRRCGQSVGYAIAS